MPIFSPLEVFPMPPPRDASLQPMGLGRPKGRHLSEILSAMDAAAGKEMSTPPGEQEWMRAQVGFLWEKAIEYVAQGMDYHDAMEEVWGELLLASRPVEKQLHFEYDNIHMTPDGFHTEEEVLEEYKFTWRSSNKWGALPVVEGEEREKVEVNASPERHFSRWLGQVRGYIHAGNKIKAWPRPIHTCRFIIFWAGGDYSYKPGRGPQPTQCMVTFPPEELEEGWEVVRAYRDWLEEEGK